MQIPHEHGVSGSNVNDGIPLCLKWALDEIVLQYPVQKKTMHVADQSKQVCPRRRICKRQLTATPSASGSGEAVCI